MKGDNEINLRATLEVEFTTAIHTSVTVGGTMITTSGVSTRVEVTISVGIASSVPFTGTSTCVAALVPATITY